MLKNDTLHEFAMRLRLSLHGLRLKGSVKDTPRQTEYTGEEI